MKITVTAEETGPEIVKWIIDRLATASTKINAAPDKIKAQVLNKEGNWVEVSPDKIKFTYVG